jgi:hypothetical protein
VQNIHQLFPQRIHISFVHRKNLKNDLHEKRNKKGDKLNAAQTWNIPVLNKVTLLKIKIKDWIIHSIVKGEKEKEEKYELIQTNKRNNSEISQESIDDPMDKDEKKKKKLKKDYYFLLSKSVSNEKYSKIIDKLGGKLMTSEFDENATHVILKSCQRTEKYLLTVASGKWLLKPEYLDECDKRKKFVNEEEFVFQFYLTFISGME